MNQAYFRPTWAEINLGNIAYNIKNMKKRLPTESQLIAVVKADAYGHGALAIAKRALEAGATGLAVALLEEAIDLRTNGIVAPILVLGRMNPAYAQLAVKYDLTVTVFQEEWLVEANLCLKEGELTIHLEIDTGMGRTGIRERTELIRIIDILKKSERISLSGVYTHFATSDEADPSYMHQQEARFQELLKDIPTEGVPIILHAANSAASIRETSGHYDAIRFGISMYGIYPSEYVKEHTDLILKSAFSLQSEIISIKHVKMGETISYGATYQTETDEWIATIPIGYGDGWTRGLQGQTVLIAGKRMPLVGRICMDQCMIKLDQRYEVGERVTLIGKQGEAEITVEEIAERLGTIPYEIPCMIGKRVPRIYTEEL